MNNLPDYLQSDLAGRSSTRRLDEAIESYRPLLASWLIELTLSFCWYKKPRYRRHGFLLEDEDYSAITGIVAELIVDGKNGDFIVLPDQRIKYSDAACARLLRQRLGELAKESVCDRLSLFANIEIVGKLLGLDAAGKAILSFAAALDVFKTFKDAFAICNEQTSTYKLAQIIAHLTGHSEAEIRTGLSEDSPLAACGVIKIESDVCDLEKKVALLEGLGDLLQQPHENENALIGKFLRSVSPSSLTLQDYPHLTQDISALKAYLGNVLLLGEQGSNILLYGAPGTGKTEFVKALADELGVDLYEIAFSDDDGDPIHGMARMRAYNLCQRILARKQNALLMFDEIEDVFQSQGLMSALFGLAGKTGGAKTAKAWVNRTLECNTTPAIWITNDPDIDPAYLRRFDYSIRFPVPPRQVRMSIARRHLGRFNPTEDWLARIASNEHMSPGQYERAAKVARISSGEDNVTACSLVVQTLDRSAALLGQKRTPVCNTIHTGYDLQFINASMDVERIIAGLKNKSRGTFCFYGPAGTGKSEFARYMAGEIGMPFLVRSASDILSMWAGEAEKNIAKMFTDARQQEAVLVLDEADSFLADRREAMRSWEVTQVNELLTQMEAFDGVFVCTTNLMEKLDQASLRRFAFKIKFDYLTPDQRWSMYLKELARLGGHLDDSVDWEKLVRRLDNLTPGDFSVVARQFDVMDMSVTPAELLQQLQEECKIKGRSAGKIGFIM